MPFELFVMADTPTQGHVNESLHSVLSEKQATDLYKAFVEDTLTGYLTASKLLSASPGLARQRQVRVHLACYPDCNHEFFQNLAHRTQVVLIDQGKGEKGERIYRLQRKAFSRGALAVLNAEVSSPALSQGALLNALDAMDRTGFVLGPTDHGGLYLWGCLRMEGEMLQDIPWGTSKVAEIFRTRLRNAEQEFEQLPEFWSIVQPDDLIRLKRLLSVEPGRAPATARVIRAIER